MMDRTAVDAKKADNYEVETQHQGAAMEGLFKHTHDALTFAFRYSSQQYALSPMAKMMKTGIGSDKGLVSLDGAGQAGIIMAHIGRLPALHQACLIARYSARYEECPCCQSQDKMTDAYREAIASLAEWAISEVTGMTLRNMRGAIIRSFFEKGVSIAATAKELNVAKRTAYDQKAKIYKGLKTLDQAAQRAIEDRLSGMCAENIETSCSALIGAV